METLPLPGMPIKVGRIVNSHGSSVYHAYREIVTPLDEQKSDVVHGLAVGESKFVTEWVFTLPFVIHPLPRRLTNVDGKLVKTFFRRPRATA